MAKVMKGSSRAIISTKRYSSRKGATAERAIIYPMMPRKYTAAQRAELRQFERDLLAGKKIRVE